MESPAGVADVLVRIVRQRRERLAAALREFSAGCRAGEMLTELAEPPKPKGKPPPLLTLADNDFLAALASRPGRAIIAEVKMKSPAAGSLGERWDPQQLARQYATNGAAALSVVVEPDFFGGSYALLASCQRSSGLPAVAKDFIVDPLQLAWTRDAGASAVLLIAALYSRDELLAYARQARTLGLVPLIETHDLADLRKLRGARWELVAVNNRNLRTFGVELSTSHALLPSLPPEALKVSASGLRSPADLAGLRDLGYQAFLIGEALLSAGDPAAKLRELSS